MDDPGSEHNLCWICTQYLDFKAFSGEQNLSRRVCRSVEGLYRHLMEGGYNYSSEHHELTSWFTETTKRNVDQRISTIERWQEESAKDSAFALDVPFIKTGYSVQGLIDRLFRILKAREKPCKTADDVARIVFSQPSQTPKS